MEGREIWRPVVGHEGQYEVSDLGRVRSVDREVWVSGSRGRAAHWHPRKGRILRPGRMNKYNHLSVAIGRGNSRTVHSLVAEAFIGPRPEDLDVCHRDGDATNNRASNLYYGTRSDNNRDITRHDRRKLTVEDVHEVRKRHAAGESGAALAREFGVCASNMSYVLRGEYYAEV